MPGAELMKASPISAPAIATDPTTPPNVASVATQPSVPSTFPSSQIATTAASTPVSVTHSRMRRNRRQAKRA
ncbi:hypothetical protein AB5I41_22530 [Sphingomonas sp. MMS24-JH45]